MGDNAVMYFVFACFGLIILYFIISAIIKEAKKRQSSHNLKTVPVHKLSNPIEAESLKSLLDENGIYCVVQSFHDSAYDGIYQLQRGWGVLLVLEKDKAKVEELITQFLNSAPQEVVASEEQITTESEPEAEAEADKATFKMSVYFIGLIVIIIIVAFVIYKVFGPFHELTSYELLEKGYYAGQHKEYDEAIKYLTMAVKKDNDYPLSSVYYYRGLAYYWTHKYMEAIKDFTSAIEADQSGDTKCYYWRAWVYNHIGEYEEAVSDCNKVIEIDAKKSGAYYIRGNSFWFTGNVNNALSDIKKVIELDSKYLWSYCTLAMIFYQQKEYDKAIDNFNKYATLDAKSAAYANLDNYRCLLKLKKPEEGLDLLNKYVKTHQSSDWPYPIIKYLARAISMDELLKDSNNIDKIVDNGQKCECYYYIGIKYLADNNGNLAKIYFNKCLETNARNYYEYRLAQIELDELK